MYAPLLHRSGLAKGRVGIKQLRQPLELGERDRFDVKHRGHPRHVRGLFRDDAVGFLVSVPLVARCAAARDMQRQYGNRHEHHRGGSLDEHLGKQLLHLPSTKKRRQAARG